jgi:endonuclease III
MKITKRKEVQKVLAALRSRYPKGTRPWEGGRNPFRSLIGTILSAQTTDAQVDLVTPKLFSRYPSAHSLAKAKRRDVEQIIKSVGLYKTKAKNIISTARTIEERFGGKVPCEREQLIQLPGVGRKTANVVLIVSFGKPAMPVDTHVFRVSRRIGLAHSTTPERVEQDLTTIIPERILGASHFWLIHHGRTLCTARNPKCPICPAGPYCNYAKRHNIHAQKHPGYNV